MVTQCLFQRKPETLGQLRCSEGAGLKDAKKLLLLRAPVQYLAHRTLDLDCLSNFGTFIRTSRSSGSSSILRTFVFAAQFSRSPVLPASGA